MAQPTDSAIHPPSGPPQIDVNGGPGVVRMAGEYDVASVAALSGRFSAAMASDPADLVVDLSGVSFMDAATIGVIMHAKALLHAQARSLWLRDPSPCARRILSICDLDALIEPEAGSDDHGSTTSLAALGSLVAAAPVTEGPADDGSIEARGQMLARTMVELADTLVDDFDVVELLTLVADRCVEVLDVSAAGLMLAEPGGELRVMASSSPSMRWLELIELQEQEGPCPDCYRTGQPVLNEDLQANDDRWPTFAPAAAAAGFRSVQALPMRFRGSVIGVLNLFDTDLGAMSPADIDAAQAFADVATIGILEHRATVEDQLVTDQLNLALNSRIAIEQAKGMVAERNNLDMKASFDLLRSHARNHHLRLLDVARSVIGGDVAPAELDHDPPSVVSAGNAIDAGTQRGGAASRASSTAW